MSNAENVNNNQPLNEGRIHIFDFARLGDLYDPKVPRWQANVIGTDIWGSGRTRKAAKAAVIEAWDARFNTQSGQEP